MPADRAVRIVLVGDEMQLPPYVEADDDEQLVQALAAINSPSRGPKRSRKWHSGSAMPGTWTSRNFDQYVWRRCAVAHKPSSRKACCRSGRQA